MVVEDPIETPERREKGANLVFLNIQKLDALKARPGERGTNYWDRGLHGFGVRVYGSGRKTFTVRYTRGIVGGEIGFSAARAEAERIVSEARNGRDPFVSASLFEEGGHHDVPGSLPAISRGSRARP